MGIHRYPRALNTGEHSNEQRATSNEPRGTERAYKPTALIRDTYLLLWWYVRQSDSLTVESTVPRPVSLVARSRTLTQPLQSLYPVCMYSGKRHRWGRVMSFGLMPHRIHTNSSNRQTSFALFAFNEATHISRSVHYACTCRSD